MDDNTADWGGSPARVVLGCLLACTLGCGGEGVSGGEGGAGSVTQFEHDLWGREVFPRWFLLVVDDAPTDAARNLRQRLAEDLQGYFDDEAAAECSSGDPAIYRPIDWQLIVVGASGTLEPRFRAEEGLHPVGRDASPDMLAAFEEAGAQAILEMETSAVLPAIAEAELAHYLNLLAGAADPRSASEAELVVSVTSDAWPWGALALTRPDASSEHPAVAWTEPSFEVLLVEWSEDGLCASSGEDDRFTLPGLAPLEVRRVSRECYEESWLFDPQNGGHCFPGCLSRLPSATENGQVVCRVYGEFPADVDCEEQPGWTFLESTLSTIIGYQNWPVNLCELRQAEGAALEACIEDLACEGCEPSFCFRRPFTAEDEDDPAHQRPAPAADSAYCASEGLQSWERLRIVHGADQVGARIRVVCQE
jgi:hypothetical protein